MRRTEDSVFCESPVHISTVETVEGLTQNGYPALKSAVDKAIASILLVLTSPIMVAAMIAIRLCSPGPVIYSQVRVGRNGVLFRMYKIRSMFHQCEDQSGP